MTDTKALVLAYATHMTEAMAALIEIAQATAAYDAPDFREFDVHGTTVTREQAVKVIAQGTLDSVELRDIMLSGLYRAFGLDAQDIQGAIDVVARAHGAPTAADEADALAGYDADGIVEALGLASAADEDIPDNER